MTMASKTAPKAGTKPRTTTKPKADASSKTTSAKTAKVQAEAAADESTKAAAPAVAQAHVSDAKPDTESAARAADVPEVSTSTHRKEFVHGPGVYTEAGGFSHEANIAATRQGIINAGLRPLTDVKHVSTKTHEDGISKVLAYEAEVIPAHLAVVSEADADSDDDARVVAYEVAHPHVIQSDDGHAPATNPAAAE